MGNKTRNEMEEVVKAYRHIEYICDPIYDSDRDKYAFNMFLDIMDDNNFVGGANDRRNTLHENMFSLLCPHLDKQVVFGTGKGGYSKYLTKRYIADFYDSHNKVIYEIDGESHTTEIQKLKDTLRDYFFLHEHGIKTIRITNKDVEQMIFDRLIELYEKGKLNIETEVA